MAVAADPARLLALARTTNDQADRLAPNVAQVATALAWVRRSCPDHLGALPPVDDQLAALVGRWRRSAEQAAGLAARLLGADRGLLAGRLGGGSVAGSLALGVELPNGWGVVISVPPPDLHRLREAAGWTLDRWHEAKTALGTAKALALLIAEAGAAGAPAWLQRAPWLAARLEPVAGRFTGPILIGLSAWHAGTDIRDAWQEHRSGIDKAEAVSGGTAQVLGTACALEPNVWTCGAATVAGTVWGGLQLSEHRKGLVAGARSLLDHSPAAPVAREAWPLILPIMRDPVKGIPVAPGLSPAVGWFDDRTEDGLRALDGALDRGREVAERAAEAGKDAVDGAIDAGKHAVDGAIDAGKDLVGKAGGLFGLGR